MYFFKNIIFFIFVISINYVEARSVHRPRDPSMPEIRTRWATETENKTHTIYFNTIDFTQDSCEEFFWLRDSHLEEGPLFHTFDYQFFKDHLLPKEPISYRLEPATTIDGDLLSSLAEGVVADLQHSRLSRDTFDHFNVLKQSDFNPLTCSGCIVFEYKDYPFVLKLFFETPPTFVDPYSKGFQQGCIFIIGAGINRHLLGFTRVRNLKSIEAKIARECPDIVGKPPRKWFWLPQNSRWFVLEGINIGCKKKQAILLPSIYGIITDKITGKPLNLLDRGNRKLGRHLYEFFDCRIDPHITNYVIEKPITQKKKYKKKRRTRRREKKRLLRELEKGNKIVPIDTEHFPSMAGLGEPMHFDNYFTWYCKMTGKYTCDKFLRTKKQRRMIQCRAKSPWATYN